MFQQGAPSDEDRALMRSMVIRDVEIFVGYIALLRLGERERRRCTTRGAGTELTATLFPFLRQGPVVWTWMTQ
jgi:hypothetical protein